MVGKNYQVENSLVENLPKNLLVNSPIKKDNFIDKHEDYLDIAQVKMV